MTLAPQTMCFSCKRLRRSLDGPSCSAFPEGIPEQIIVGGFDHRQPFPGDGGQRFVQHPDKPLPSRYPETVEPQQPVMFADPGEIRTQTKRELRETAKGLIAKLRNHPDAP